MNGCRAISRRERPNSRSTLALPVAPLRTFQSRKRTISRLAFMVRWSASINWMISVGSSFRQLFGFVPQKSCLAALIFLLPCVEYLSPAKAAEICIGTYREADDTEYDFSSQSTINDLSVVVASYVDATCTASNTTESVTEAIERYRSDNFIPFTQTEISQFINEYIPSFDIGAVFGDCQLLVHNSFDNLLTEEGRWNGGWIRVCPNSRQAVEVSFEFSNYRVDEGSAPNILQVRIVATSFQKPSEDFYVSVSTAPVDAAAPDDYVALSDTVGFHQDSFDLKEGTDSYVSYQTVSVEIVNDDNAESDERFMLQLEQAPGMPEYVKIIDDRSTVTIVDDDEGQVTLEVDADTVNEGGVPTTVTLTARLTGSPRDTDTELTVMVSGATASSDDFEAVPEFTLTIDAGAPSGTATFTLTPIDDDRSEGNETVSVTARDVPGLAVSGTSVTIIDDDEARVTLEVDADTVDEGGAPTTVTLTARLTGNPRDTDTELTILVSGGTADGTASSDDFEADPAEFTLTIDAGASSGTATFTLTPTDDDRSEENETVSVTATTDVPGLAVSGTSVTIEDDDPPPPVDPIPPVDPMKRKIVEQTVKAVVASTVSNVSTNIGARFSAARTGGTKVTLGGWQLPVLTGGGVNPGLDEPGGWQERPNPIAHRSWTASGEQLFRNSDFEISLGASDNGSNNVQGWSGGTLWGRGDLLFFEKASNDDERYEANLQAGYLGFDTWLDDSWLMGIAVSKTRAEADYGQNTGGDLSLTLTGMHPYIRYAPNNDSEFWAIAGFGFGEIQNDNKGVGNSTKESSSARTVMGAAGARWNARAAEDSGLGIAILGDAGFGRLESDAGSGAQAIDNLAVDSWRARFGVEGSYAIPMTAGPTVTPIAELAARYDGGGGEDNVGIELTGGVAFSDPESGLGIEARAHTLLVYSVSDYREYGGSLSASFSPGPNGEGLSLGLSSRLGHQSDRVSLPDGNAAFHPTESEAGGAPALVVNAIAGYSMTLAPSRVLLTPFGEVNLAHSGETHRERVGVRLSRAARIRSWTLELAGARRAVKSSFTEHKVNLLGRLRF